MVILPEDYVRSNKLAWDRAARTYHDEVERDIAWLRDGGVNLLAPERELLGDLSHVGRAIHLQCSHGLDALSLLNLGVSEVIGLDLSPAMLAQAQQKTQALQAPARWIEGDVLAPPSWLDGTADLVYTGRGALPWVHDLDQWAAVVARLLRPNGRLFVFEGHPLNWVWSTTSTSHQLRADGRGYFDAGAHANDDFPAAAVARYTPAGTPVPDAWEWPWTLGEVVTAVAQAGLRVERLQEFAENFWDQFPELSPEDAARLPHSYGLIASAANRP
ncbi:MAG: class I SAM-dependent methyltransferase [Bacteroidota bacterium]